MLGVDNLNSLQADEGKVYGRGPVAWTDDTASSEQLFSLEHNAFARSACQQVAGQQPVRHAAPCREQ